MFHSGTVWFQAGLKWRLAEFDGAHTSPKAKEGVSRIMPIPESKLGAWSHHGSQKAAIRTHETIRRALDNYTWPQGMNYDFYLQGSYHNDTNLVGESDVDVVLELDSPSQQDRNSLPNYGLGLAATGLQPQASTWNDFRREALKALQQSFGDRAVGQGNKSIKLKGASRRLATDIVVCMKYQKSASVWTRVEGIAFQALQDKHWVINFPKLHHENGAAKGTRTGDRFKRTVRMFKGARNHLRTTGQIRSGLAPSYFLECLLYNAPDWVFQERFDETYCAIVNWMNQTNMASLPCQNGQQYLFGQSEEQWSLEDAKALGAQLANLWNN